MPLNTGSDPPAMRRRAIFIIHLWREDLSGGEWEWRGKVQGVPEGEAAYFRDWETLERFMQEYASKLTFPVS